MTERKAPICPLCKIRERSFDGEPPVKGDDRDYFSHCYECSSLCGTREHTHTYYGSPAQVAAGTYAAGHSWRTTVPLIPLWEGETHVGFRCTRFQYCGWERRFTPDEMELCPDEHKAHGGWPTEPTIKAMCINNWDHRLARGEIELPHGYITEHGRQAEGERSDAANWDPGHYVQEW